MDAFEEYSRIFGIGNTPLIRAKRLEDQVGIKKIYLKNEGHNPTKTYKDRHALMHVLSAINNGYKDITVGTCGNYGAAIAHYATHFDLGAHIFVPNKYSNRRLNELQSAGVGLIREKGEYEDVVRSSIKSAKENDWYDANSGSNIDTSLTSCSYISKELVRDLGEVDTISVPVGNGTILSGIYNGFIELLKRKEILNMPRIVGVSTQNNNAVIESFKMGLKIVRDLNPLSLRLSEVNEPLIAFHCFGGQRALDAIYGTDGSGIGLTDEKMTLYQKMILTLEGIKTLPASAGALGGLIEFHKEHNLDDGVHVVILTGSG
ncbi:MAG: pyridoxal-phosphate dependent enzyme [Halobacteriota archaeon]|nr:pyridoxal-phosphate dependent enzyme [Halobacteriota archaeon]